MCSVPSVQTISELYLQISCHQLLTAEEEMQKSGLPPAKTMASSWLPFAALEAKKQGNHKNSQDKMVARTSNVAVHCLECSTLLWGF